MYTFTVLLINTFHTTSAFQDPRMIQVMGVLLGIDMQAFDNRRGASAAAPGANFDTPPESPRSPSASTSTSKPAPPPTAPAPDVKMAEPEEEEEPDEEAQAKKAALKEKDLGNAAYKKREFAEAEAHFTKAWDLWPKDMTFLTNLAGAFSVSVAARA
jgi:stress-induced-phosphoprotein 1